MPDQYSGHVQANSKFYMDQDRSVEYLFGVQFPSGATSGEVTVPDNVTFIFTGGKITSSIPCNIIGVNTKILAPITQIFGENIEATGSWVIDRAYPQWFGYTPNEKKVPYRFTNDDGHGRKYSQDDSTVPDGGLAIRKAIEMKKNGEVFLPHGFYIIKTPIIMRVGIQLVGEKGQGSDSYSAENHFQGAVLQAWKEFAPYSNDPNNPININTVGVLSDDSNEFMLYFNTSPDNINGKLTDSYNTGFLAGQISEIRDLTFANYISSSIELTGTDEERALKLMAQSTACLKCIYGVDALSIENVRFEYFRQAVVFKPTAYIDSKRIVNCATSTNISQFAYLDNEIYSFDLRGLGDAFLFEHNVLDGWYNKGLKLRSGNGGKVSCNIINADCQFTNFKGLIFNNNHMEYGHQVEVICSNVTFIENYIEKRYKPSIRIRGDKWHNRSVVSIINDLFLFYENSRLINTREYNDALARIEVPSGSIPSEFSTLADYKAFLALKSVSEEICEYDIDIDLNTELNISNTYRYRITNSGAGAMHQTGIAMRAVTYTYNSNNEVTDESYVDFTQFNDYSFMLSKQGQISPGLCVLKDFTVNGVNETVGMTPQYNNTMTWMAESGYCEYRFQMIFDKQRPLVGTFNSSQLFSTEFPENQDGNRIMGHTGGILLAINPESELNGNHKLLRVYRYIKNEYEQIICRHYVDIPLSGTRLLYDNGISINGYKWETFTGTANAHSLKGDLGLQSIMFEGKHVRCRTTSAESDINSRTQWLKGDELLNANYNPDDNDPENDWTVIII